jgi:general L-amino acid transport system permease protein
MANELPRSGGNSRSSRTDWSHARSRNETPSRALIYQALLAAAVGLVAWYIVSNTIHNLEARGIASGFQFLSREAGFEISETTLISYDATSTYRRAIAVGFLNTFRVAVFGIVIATILGAVIGIARLARNWLLAKLAAVYVELIRNVPLLVQLFFGTRS